jgi:ABC-type nitrate/sulfonate/bicarbonate transport system substrate-binding protein
VDIVPGQGARQLAEGDYDAYFSFWPASQWQLEEFGVTPAFLPAFAHGVEFYGDFLFTNGALARQNPELVQKFVDATIAGWVYAAAHVDEMAASITENLERTLPIADLLGFNRNILREIANMVLHNPPIDIGHSNPGKWSRMFEVLAAAGLASGGFKYRDYVFDPDFRESQFRQALLVWVSAGLFLAVFSATAFLSWTWILRKQVAARTRDLSESENRYSLAVAGTDAGIWDWNARPVTRTGQAVGSK